MTKYAILFIIGFIAAAIYQIALNNNLPIVANGVDIHLDFSVIAIVLLLISNLIALMVILCKRNSDHC
jgi:hypothetical protein